MPSMQAKVAAYNKIQQDNIHTICEKYYEKFKALGFTAITPQQVGGLSIELGDSPISEHLTLLIVEFCNFKLAIGTPQQLPKEERRPLASAIRIEVLRRDGNKCVECGRTASQTPLEIHHIVPVARGGTDELSNLRTLCKSCNDSISDRRMG